LRRRTLRFRLQVAFLALSLLPGVALTLLLLQSLPWALDQWASPGVRQTFQNALAVAGETLSRIQNDLRQRWSLSLDLAGPALWGGAEERDPPIGGRLNLDFLVLYPPEPDSNWTPVRVLTRDPLVAAPSGLLPWGGGDLETGLFLRGGRGELAFAQRIPREGDRPGPVLAVGIYLDPALYERLADLNTALVRHDQLEATADLNKTAVYIGAGLLLVLLAGAGTFVAGRLADGLSSPVEDLARAMERVARGEPNIHVEAGGTDEIRSLVSAFNQMTADLAESRERAARAERAAAWRDAARRVAHEIRNPLQPITLALHRIEKTLGDDPERGATIRASVASILDEVEALKRLASSFSELARMPDPEPEPTRLGEFVRRVAPLLDFPGARVTIEAPGDGPLVLIDRGQFREVLTNLVKNAAEAMPDGGDVVVRVTAPAGSRSTVHLEVEDSGPGVPAELAGRLFEPHVTTKTGGSGLGLAIVDRIVTAHGGRIEVMRGAAGGALFRVHLSTPEAA
jgi:nitrogen fixation/metabolism regulation signal transduction histidine kinase